MSKLISTWKELALEESETHRIEYWDRCAWIVDKETEEYSHYLSTHTFYGATYQHSTALLQKYGFDVQLKNWDEGYKEFVHQMMLVDQPKQSNVEELKYRITQKFITNPLSKEHHSRYLDQLIQAVREEEEIKHLKSQSDLYAKIGNLEGILRGVTFWDIPVELSELINEVLNDVQKPPKEK